MIPAQNTAEGMGLPRWLQGCVERGILGAEQAMQVDRFRRAEETGQDPSPRLEKANPRPTSNKASLYTTRQDRARDFSPLLLQTEPNPMLTFESFIPCKTNAFPLEMARTVAEKRGVRQTYNPLYLYSNVGLGKTHLLSAIANKTFKQQTTMMVNTADLDLEFERAVRLGFRAEFRRWLIGAEVLLVDDIQLCEGNESLQQELFAVLNHTIRLGRAAVISSDVPPTRLRGIEERLLSRLSGGVIVGLNMAEKSERRQFLEAFLEETPFAPEILDYLAEQIQDNIRHLKAVALQLLALRRVLGRELELVLVQRILPVQTRRGTSQQLLRVPERVTPADKASSPEKTGQAEKEALPGQEALSGQGSLSEKGAPLEEVTSSEELAGGQQPDNSPSAAETSSEKVTPAKEGVFDGGACFQGPVLFKEMLSEAQSPEEQALALQIALTERLRQLRLDGAPAAALQPLEQALACLRQGELESAIQCLS